MMKVSVLEPKLNPGRAYPFTFVTSAERLDVKNDAYSILGDIRVDGSIVFTGKAFRLKGSVYLKKAFVCDRCLEDFEQERELSFSEDFKQDGGLCESGDDALCFSGDYIEIADLFRETILLSEPLSQICSSDCLGLCQKCGANLNKAECGCDRHVIDPRLAELRKIFKSET